MNKIFFSLSFAVILVFLIFASGHSLGLFFASRADSSQSDAIAIRVVPNPDHLSALGWYKEQGFSGSPQSIIVDGYRGIREGRTVYVNVGNVDGDVLHTNIYLISYNQNSGQQTQDIFGRILRNWRFNTNFSALGRCEKALDLVCRLDVDCPVGDFCASDQARLRRDVYRMEAINKIENLLAEYREENGQYPSLNAGSYLPRISLSAWPSWPRHFSQVLGSDLPTDPVNELGDCGDSRFQPKTCWDEDAKEFADIDPSDPALDLPAGSRVFLYEFVSESVGYRLCGYFESPYRVVDSDDYCVLREIPNQDPVISGFGLSNSPNQEYAGYIGAVDPDGDDLAWEVSLVRPASPSAWEDMGWIWGEGRNGFEVVPMDDFGQIMIRAERAGFTANPGDYRINVTARDGRGGVISETLDINLDFYAMELDSGRATSIIGQPRSVALSGTDNSRRALENLLLEDASLDSAPISDISDHGFSLDGMALEESFAPAQRTGSYSFEVYSLDPITLNRVDSDITFNIINNPPEINSAEIGFENGTTQDCSPLGECSFLIYNQEAATLRVNANDSDPGHNVSFAILNNPGALSVDDSGLVTGFADLNSGSLEARNYSFEIEATDQYCEQSEPEECTDTMAFDFEIMPFCSVDDTGSADLFELADPFFTAESGQAVSIGGWLSGCRDVGNSRLDMDIFGEGRDQALVFVLDISNSMRTVIDGLGAIDRVKATLASDGGVLDNLLSFTAGVPSTIQVGIIAYNSEVTSLYPLSDISLPGVIDDMKSTVNSYNAHSGTHTLDALNEAELMLESVTDPDIDRAVLLMSDGYPVIRTVTSEYICQERTCGCGIQCQSRTDNPGLCYFSGTRTENCCSAGRSYCSQQGICCPGFPGDPAYEDCCYEECWEHDMCPWGARYPSECTHPECSQCGYCGTCYSPPNPTGCPCGIDNAGTCWAHCATDCVSRKDPDLKNEPDFKIAITEQTECISGRTGPTNAECAVNPGNCAYARPISSDVTAQCDISFDTSNQAQSLKDLGIALYTIYFDTQGAPEIGERMCEWSSEEAADCPAGGTYAFAGTEVEEVIDQALGNIIIKPNNVLISDLAVSDPDPFASESFIEDLSIDSLLTCGSDITELPVTFGSEGEIAISELAYYHCPNKETYINENN